MAGGPTFHKPQPMHRPRLVENIPSIGPFGVVGKSQASRDATKPWEIPNNSLRVWDHAWIRFSLRGSFRFSLRSLGGMTRPKKRDESEEERRCRRNQEQNERRRCLREATRDDFATRVETFRAGCCSLCELRINPRFSFSCKISDTHLRHVLQLFSVGRRMDFSSPWFGRSIARRTRTIGRRRHGDAGDVTTSSRVGL